jgi:hypothetical protein
VHAQAVLVPGRQPALSHSPDERHGSGHARPGSSKMHGKIGVHEVGVDGACRACASTHGTQHSGKGRVGQDLRAAVSGLAW